MPPPSSEVITFYSYKGGVGRTMALANVAWLLATNGYRVLMIDWDLEAPGLHRYFYPFLDDPGFERSSGLLDLLWEYVVAAKLPLDQHGPGLEVPLDLARASRVAVPVQFEYASPGCLHLVGAGLQDDDYAQRLHRFDWAAFYEGFSGAAFVDRLVSQARAEYDVILVDSRTGVADTSGICTLQIPDQVVLCFTYNRQSVEGTAAIARTLRDQRKDLRLLLRPTRVVRDVEGLAEARQFASALLNPFLSAEGEIDSEIGGSLAADRDTTLRQLRLRGDVSRREGCRGRPEHAPAGHGSAGV